MIVNYKKLTKTAKEPTRGSEYSAGFDLYADIEEENKRKAAKYVKLREP